MEQLFNDLLGRMYARLQEIAATTDNHLQRAEQSFCAVEAVIRELKEAITTREFRSEADEIRFFKETKPLFIKELVFYTELYYIESNKPVAGTEAVKYYYTKTLESLATTFEKHKLLYNYYRAGKSDLDEVYFLRRIELPQRQPVYPFDLDPVFSTPHSNTLGQLMAFEELSRFLERAITARVEIIAPAGERKKQPRVWKATAVSLFEVGLGIWKSGAVTQGPGGFQQFMIDLGEFFNIKVGNVSRVVLGMSYRKKGRTPFLHNMIDATERSFEEKDI